MTGHDAPGPNLDADPVRDPDQPTGITQTASGHNVIQQVGSGVARIFDVDVNISVLGGAVVGGSVLVMTLVLALVLTRLPPLEPIEGPGLKVAVAALQGPGTAGRKVGAFMASSLQRALPTDDFTVAGPSRVRDVPTDPASASRTSQDLLADVLLYGEVQTASGPTGTVTVHPRVVVASQGTRDSLPFVLDHSWGPPFAVVPDDLSNVEPVSLSSVESLVSFVGAVGALAADNFDRARSRLDEAGRAAQATGDATLAATVEAMAGFVELRAASVAMDVATLPAARDHFDAALEHDPDMALAQVGLLAVDYLHLLDDDGATRVRTSSRERLLDLVRAFDEVAARTDDRYARVTAQALAAQAVLASVQGPGPQLDLARERFDSLLASLPDLQQRPWGLFESFIQEKLGLIAAIAGDTARAIAHYEAATARASPYWAAFSLAAIGELELDRGNPCAAAASLAAAAATIQGRFPEAASYRDRGDEADQQCSEE